MREKERERERGERVEKQRGGECMCVLEGDIDGFRHRENPQ